VKLYATNVEVLRKKEKHDELNLPQKLMVFRVFPPSALNINVFLLGFFSSSHPIFDQA
jgi:hypothetical protein